MKTLRKIMGLIITICSFIVMIFAAMTVAIVAYLCLIGGEVVATLMAGEFILIIALCVIVPIVMFKISRKVMD